MISYANTDELYNIARELQTQVADLERELDSLYNRLEKVPTVTKEWIGTQADYYFAKIAQDKQRYKSFTVALENIGTELNHEATLIQNYVRANK